MLILLACLELLLCAAGSLISTVVLATPTTILYPYFNNTISTSFNDTSRRFNCALPNIYTYQQTPAQLNSNTPYNLTIFAIGNYSIRFTTRYNNFVPQITPTNCDGNCVVTIVNNCPNPFSSYNYFDEINLYIGDLPPISYRVDCDDSFNPSVFQWGLLILITLVTILMFAASYFSKCESYGGAGITLGYKILIGINLLLLVSGVLGAFFVSVTNVIV